VLAVQAAQGQHPGKTHHLALAISHKTPTRPATSMEDLLLLPVHGDAVEAQGRFLEVLVTCLTHLPLAGTPPVRAFPTAVPVSPVAPAVLAARLLGPITPSLLVPEDLQVLTRATISEELLSRVLRRTRSLLPLEQALTSRSLPLRLHRAPKALGSRSPRRQSYDNRLLLLHLR
jgi:hypothetical protein